jgi:competence protein ComEC
MLRLALGLAAGVWTFQQSSVLPAWPWLLLGVVVAMGLLRWRGPGLPFAACLGLAWAHAYALANVPAWLPVEGERVDLVATGHIVSLVDADDRRARFIFAAERLASADGVTEGDWRVRVSWYSPPPLAAGQRWHLPLRLRHAHGYASPGSWDYEGWLYWQGVRYTGYVKEPDAAVLEAPASCCGLARLRERLGHVIDSHAVSDTSAAIIRAITIGDRSQMAPDLRETLQATGTAHLMAISGLHVSLVAGIGGLLTGFLWARIPRLCGRVPARIPAAIAGGALALPYALIAGFALPTQRALVMLLVVCAALLLRRQPTPPQILALAAIAVLAWHPPSIVAAGFWLSFGAVATILAVIALTQGLRGWQRMLLVHAALSIALWPLLAVFGLPASTVSVAANLLAVPWFSIFVIPPGLLGVALAGWLETPGRWLIGLAGHAVDAALAVLERMAALPMPDLAATALPGVALAIAVTGLVLLLSPSGNPLRWLGLPLIFVVFLPRQPELREGEFDLHVLDVGQGLSVIVTTARHTLVYDTGPAFDSGFNTADAVVLPFLREVGRHRVDLLVLSHGDLDHAGGASMLRDGIAIGDVLSGEPGRVSVVARPCERGQAWGWDGVRFTMLHPEPGADWRGNDASCVLRIDNGNGSVLLTGDIESRVERMLAEKGRLAPATVVFAPHHGSRSSSSGAFVETTRPTYVAYAAGWANRYGFPAAEVRQRWEATGAVPAETARAGTVTFRFGRDGLRAPPSGYRESARRYWWHLAGSADSGHAVSSADRKAP